MMRVGCVSYINALPFTLPMKLGAIQSPFEWHFATPAALNCSLLAGELDGALTSSVISYDNDLLPLSYGICARNKVFSVNLYSSLPIKELDGKRICLSSHSATSNELLKVLCRNLWKIEPAFRRDRANCSAFLLIGNEALDRHSLAGFETIDLCQAWYDLSGLPFVFALFYLSNQNRDKVSKIEQALHCALEWSTENRGLIETEAKKYCPCPQDLITRYFDNLSYTIGPQEKEALHLFDRLRNKEEP